MVSAIHFRQKKDWDGKVNSVTIMWDITMPSLRNQLLKYKGLRFDGRDIAVIQACRCQINYLFDSCFISVKEKKTLYERLNKKLATHLNFKN